MISAEMRRLLTLLACFLAFAVAVRAEQWRSDRYRCTLTFPPGESWVQGIPTPLPAGEMIYNGTNTTSRQGAAVIVVPKMPNNDLENPAVINRIMEPMVALGFQVVSHAPVTVNEQRFLQLVCQRGDTPTMKLIAVARAAIRENTLYIALTFARGEAELANDKHFLRVIDTFTLLEDEEPITIGATGALIPRYRLAYQAAFGSIGGLLLLSLGALFFSRRPAHRA